jgi:hypothetical protein
MSDTAVIRRFFSARAITPFGLSTSKEWLEIYDPKNTMNATIAKK